VEDSLSKTRMEIQTFLKEIFYFFPDLYILHNLYILTPKGLGDIWNFGILGKML
jgi:hypothetical protein